MQLKFFRELKSILEMDDPSVAGYKDLVSLRVRMRALQKEIDKFIKANEEDEV